jgi:hypothetical protein
MDPVVIENDSSDKLIWCYPQPKCTTPWAPPTSMADLLSQYSPPVDLSTVSDQLQLLAKASSSLMTQGNSPPSHLSRKLSRPAPDDSQPSPILASTMSWDEVMSLVHCAGSSRPPICPCNTANASDTKMNWSAKELHRVMGCQKFCNYKHLLQVSCDGEWVDDGKFPPLLGSFATIPKAKWALPLDRMSYHYLDAVHMDIVFGNCLLFGGFRYALILVDPAMHFNWTFGLKSLSSKHILGTLCLFCAAAGNLARCF